MTERTASEAARSLARARWGDRGLVRAVQVVVDRQDELTADQLAELRAVADERKADDGE